MRILRALPLAALFFTIPALGQTPAAPPPAQAPDPIDRPLAETVDLKQEALLLEDVFARRTALHWLRVEPGARGAILADLDPESAAAIQRFAEHTETFTNLDYHFLEKIANCEKRILATLRKDGFQGIEDVLEVVKDRAFPATAAYANLLNTLEMNLRFAMRRGIVDAKDFAEDLPARLTAESVRVNGTSGHTTDDLAKERWKEAKPADFPAWWFDPSSGRVSYAFGPVPQAPEYPTIDLNTATVGELTSIPGVESEAAEAIVEYARERTFQGPEEMRLVDAVPRHLVEPLETLCSASHVRKQRRWTVMVYLNAANNLEPYGIEDLNEMEKVGSTRDVNVVVELARYHGDGAGPQPNGSYFHNPYSEIERPFYVGLQNEPGAARYYVLQDDDAVRVRSVVKENAGDTDAGRPESLAGFGKWAVERYPADHYALVIWNHGAGWSGVSFDDNTRHGLDLPEVREALEDICAALGPQGKERIDVLDFDACLMATAEVGYELKDTVDWLCASQEVEPGDGMPYDEVLGWIAKYPEAPPASFVKSMVEAYVKSYAPKGSQVDGDQAYFAGTKSALRLARFGELRDRIERVAALLLERPALLGAVAEKVVGDARAFGRLVDVHDFLERLVDEAGDDAELKAAADAVCDLIGYPTDRYELVNEVVIKRRSPGSVIWGFNGWKSPPRQLAPFVHQSRYARTPLTGPDERGNYVAHLEFPPMLPDPKTKKPVFVEQIDYHFDDDETKRTLKDFENTFITTDFAQDAAVIAEGHMVANSRSHGVSLYFPAYLGFDPEYRRLRFAADSKWTALLETFPLQRIEDAKPVALLGIRHADKQAREELGVIRVRDAFRDAAREHDFAREWKDDLGALGYAFDVVDDPRPYGEDWLGLIQNWRDGVVVLDNHEGIGAYDENPFAHWSSRWRLTPQIAGPEGRTVLRHLENGGALLLATPDAARATWDQPLYHDALGLRYGERWDLSYDFHVMAAGIDPQRAFTIEPSRKGEAIVTFAADADVEPFCVLPAGQMIGARVARTHPETGASYRAVVLGFHVTDVVNAEDRRALVEEAMRFLLPSDAAAPAAPAVPPDLSATRSGTATPDALPQGSSQRE